MLSTKEEINLKLLAEEYLIVSFQNEIAMFFGCSIAVHALRYGLGTYPIEVKTKEMEIN